MRKDEGNKGEKIGEREGGSMEREEKRYKRMIMKAVHT